MLVEDNLEEVPKKIVFGILKLLNINTSDFENKLLDDDPYYIKIYAWIYARYHENRDHKKQDKKNE
ncbi:hypothetical protein [Aquimarina longa]|uniref:hypothetical protein n=1 Tax=Aquimarina longa TaxID=1080221 RepID=UPI00078260E6|nr:hypothetical protein [Aquimarina longa]